MANKKERTQGGKETKKRNSKQKTTTLLSEKKEEAGNVSEQQVKGWIHDTTHLSRQQHGRERRSRTKTEWAVSWNIETTTPHLYIVNERYNSRNQKASKEEKTNKQIMNVDKKRQLAQPQTLTQGGPRNRLSIELERTNLVHRYEWWNKQG